jgi:hypothetical protein
MDNTKDAHLSRQADAGKNSRRDDAGSLLCKAELRDRNTDLAVGPAPEPVTDENLTLEISFR